MNGPHLPNFHIPHLEKIEWMIETNGWALEVIPPHPDPAAPIPGAAYTLGFPATFGFAEVILVGLTPAAAHSIAELVADCLRGGAEIPLGVEVVGLLDGELRCVFAVADPRSHGFEMATADAWHRGQHFDVVQMLWPDRNGFLPYEVGYDQRLRGLQPLLTRQSE